MAKRHQKYKSAWETSADESFKPGDLIIGYFRDSGGKDQDRSVDEQLFEWRQECINQGLVPVRTFEERARSGTSARSRQKLLEMVEYFESGGARREGVRGLLLYSFARFARQQDDFHFFISLIRRSGYIVRSIVDKIPDGDFSRIMEAFVAWKDAQFSKDLGKQVSRGLGLVLSNYRSDGGLYELSDGSKVQLSAGGFPPIGYDRVLVQTGENRRGTPRFNAYWKKTVDEGLARRVRLAWEMCLAGRSYREIEMATELGLGRNSWNDFFNTETYVGVYNFGNFRREGAFEPYVTRSEFEQVQQMIANRATGGLGAGRNVPHKYVLSGLSRCGACGSAVVGSRYAVSGRTPYWYYECASRVKARPCPGGKVRIRADKLEPLVIEAVAENLNEERIKNLACRLAKDQLERFKRSNVSIIELENSIVAESERIDRLIEQLPVAGELGILEDLKAKITQAKIKRDKAQDELAKAKINEWVLDPAAIKVNEEKLLNARRLLCNLPLPSGKFLGAYDREIELGRGLLETLCVGVYFYPAERAVMVRLDLSALIEPNFVTVEVRVRRSL